MHSFGSCINVSSLEFALTCLRLSLCTCFNTDLFVRSFQKEGIPERHGSLSASKGQIATDRNANRGKYRIEGEEMQPTTIKNSSQNFHQGARDRKSERGGGVPQALDGNMPQVTRDGRNNMIWRNTSLGNDRGKEAAGGGAVEQPANRPGLGSKGQVIMEGGSGPDPFPSTSGNNGGRAKQNTSRKKQQSNIPAPNLGGEEEGRGGKPNARQPRDIKKPAKKLGPPLSQDLVVAPAVEGASDDRVPPAKKRGGRTDNGKPSNLPRNEVAPASTTSG